MLVHVENFRNLETMKDPSRNDGFEEIQKMGPVLESKVTHHLYHCGIEIKIDSLQSDGSQSWIVINRGINA